MAQRNKTYAQVEEEKRGVFSGVETSICYGMDLVKFVLVRTKISLMDFLEYFIIEVQQYKNDTFQVLFFPSPTEHFGYLVLVSFTSVFGGLCFFVLFVWFVTHFF